MGKKWRSDKEEKDGEMLGMRRVVRRAGRKVVDSSNRIERWWGGK